MDAVVSRLVKMEQRVLSCVTMSRVSLSANVHQGTVEGCVTCQYHVMHTANGHLLTSSQYTLRKVHLLMYTVT